MKKTSVAVVREKEELLNVPFDPAHFNKSFIDNQGEITRIFMHLFQKYPLVDGKDDAFNRLFVAFAELKVFQRWSVARVVRAEVKRRTNNERKAAAVYQRLVEAGNDEAEKIANDMGINLKAKRGQFLYKWIEHILGSEYLQDGNRTRRFTVMSPDEPVHHTWSTDRQKAGFIPWSSRRRDADPRDRYEGTGAWGIASNHESRHFPHYSETPSCVGDYTYANAQCCIEDEIAEGELNSSINDGLNDLDRFIVSKRAEGYTLREIQAQLVPNGFSDMAHQAVYTRLRNSAKRMTNRIGCCIRS